MSSGTWSLVGLELDEPVITDDSRAANFTNEGGVDHRVRFLRNVGGLWLLQESQRQWSIDGDEHELSGLLAKAADVPPDGPVIDVDDSAFIAPDDMPARIQAACRDSGQPVPQTQAEIVRCILDSLAVGYARTVADGERLAGRTVVGHPHRRRRLPERLAVSADRGLVRATGARRAGRGNRARQCHGAGPGCRGDRG